MHCSIKYLYYVNKFMLTRKYIQKLSCQYSPTRRNNKGQSPIVPMNRVQIRSCCFPNSKHQHLYSYSTPTNASVSAEFRRASCSTKLTSGIHTNSALSSAAAALGQTESSLRGKIGVFSSTKEPRER